jgi:hypothetical protein
VNVFPFPKILIVPSPAAAPLIIGVILTALFSPKIIVAVPFEPLLSKTTVVPLNA